MWEFAEREGIRREICGKVIVAVDDVEIPRLQALYERGVANDVRCEQIGPDRLAEIEPHARGQAALYLPDAGMVDYRAVCDRWSEILRDHGHRIFTGTEVTGLHEGSDEVVATTVRGDFTGKYLVNCAGLYSDRVAAMADPDVPARIVPFRGEYYKLKPEAEHLVRHLIYPVPDPQFPFLGVHFTRMLEGVVECGPNAVLAFGREAYRKSQVNVRDLADSLTYSGFQKLAARHWRMGLGEMWRSFSKAAFVTALQRMMPELSADQLEPAPSGIRAQAVAPDGSMLDDFAWRETPRMVHVINAPSPAATAAISIGHSIVDRLLERF